MEGPPIEFEWDEAKSERTKQVRGISFEDASLVFLDEGGIILNARRTLTEERYMALGKISKDVLLTVVYTWRIYGVRKVCRIISARKSSKAERRRYTGLRELPGS